MLCPACQTSNFRDYKYCRECGSPLPAGPLVVPSLNGGAKDPQVEVLLEQAMARSAAGELDEAVGAVQGALAVEPDCAPAHSLLGELYEKQNRPADAIASYERALELNPSSNRDRERLAALAAPVGPLRTWNPTRIALASGLAAGIAVFGVGMTVMFRQSANTSHNRTADAHYQPAVSRPVPLPTPPLSSPARNGSVAGSTATAGAPGAGLPYKITAGAGTPAGATAGRSQLPTISFPRGTTGGAAGLAISPGALVPPGPSETPRANQTPAAPNPNGLPAAAIGVVEPLPTQGGVNQTGGAAQPGGAPGGPAVTATFGPRSGSPANGAAPIARSGAPGSGAQPQTEKRIVEPFETDSGFIKIEPSENGGSAQKRPATSGQPVQLPPSISVSFSSTSGAASGEKPGSKKATPGDERKRGPGKSSGITH